MEKVLVLAAPLGSIGGVQNYTETLFAAATEILGRDNVRLLAVPAEPETRADGSISLGRVTKLRFVASALGTAMLWRPDLIICAHIGVAPVARIVKESLGIHYWLVLYGIEVWGDMPASKRRALQSADKLISISRFTLNAAISRHGLASPDAVILPPAFANGNFAAESMPQRTLINVERPTVLTVGRMASSERYKGHDVMLEAWPTVLEQIPDAQYLIVGEGDDRARLEARAMEIGAGDSITFAGSVTKEELQACYEGCQVFAMPAQTAVDTSAPRGEGFGIVFLEAMNHAKPVLGPSLGAPAEFIRHGEHGFLVDPAQPAEVARALVELLRDPERARDMGNKGREWVSSEFSYEIFRQRLGEALQMRPLNHGMGEKRA